MSSIEISESGVKFGPFDENNIFLIESLTENYFSPGGISRVEFVLKTGNSVYLVEAKSSIPRETEYFFCGIKSKIVHSLILWFNLTLSRLSSANIDLPENLRDIQNLQQQIRLLLIIPDVPNELLPQFSEAFRSSLRKERLIWGIDYQNVLVLNKEKATGLGLVSA